MKAYVYKDNSSVRCRIDYEKYQGHYSLQIQRKKWIFWVNEYAWKMFVREGFWGENRVEIIKTSFASGHASEAYRRGTLDSKKRAGEYIEEYLSKKQQIAIKKIT